MHMRQLLTAAVVALSLAGFFAAAAAQTVGHREAHSYSTSSTPSGGGLERPVF
jgi:hypothetical protein